MFNNVDFPEPELPTIKTTSPCSIEKDICYPHHHKFWLND